MNANKLADDLDNANGFQYIAQLGLASQAATMLRQQQAEIEALKKKVKQNADLNEKVYLCKKKLKPIVWMAEVEGGTMYTNYEYPESVPLYTHPVKALCKAELTDEEIKQIFQEQTGFFFDDNPADDLALMDFARAILRKVSEK